MIVHKIIYTKDIETNPNSFIVYIIKDTLALVACTRGVRVPGSLGFRS